MVLYDILGDVVCGGFFEPMRAGFVDVMYIVTSGEFNSLFAANNLCKGYVNCNLQRKGVKFGGIIANCRGIKREIDIVKEFSKLVGIPVICSIPRSEEIEKCTIDGEIFCEVYPELDASKEIEIIGESILQGNITDVIPVPLALNDLRNIYKRLRSEY